MQAFLPLYFLAVLEGFGEVSLRDGFGLVEVGDGAGDFEDFEVGAGREFISFGGGVVVFFCLVSEGTVLNGFGGAKVGIIFTTSVNLCVQGGLNKFFGSLVLTSARCCIF